MTTDVASLSPLTVPANSSRFFRTRVEALEQPTATVELCWTPEDPYLFNAGFDEGLIRHDDSYCTSVVNIARVPQLPTMSYFGQILPHLPSAASIIDIGCGQGEFVEALRGEGLDASGFDPVLRQTKPYLHPWYWDPSHTHADVYVMRCVLPHIPEPWIFLNAMAEASPGSLALIEFQQLEWILEEGIWYQISHDHVNLFSLKDFADRYRVIKHGTFANGEWAWVLIDPSGFHAAPYRRCDLNSRLRDLLELRKSTLRRAADLDRPIAIWGAAGKGIVLGHSLVESEVERVTAIDADPHRWDLYLERSGIPVISPAQAQAVLPSKTLVLVCNPNHFTEIKDHVSGRWELALPRDIV